MKILVFSDSHGRQELMSVAIKKELPDLVLHLGDNLSDVRELHLRFPILDMYGVKGNCDILPVQGITDKLVEADGKKIFMTHGHEYGVKFGYSKLISAAHAKGADVVLFGHTHKAWKDMDGDMWVINPGSCGEGSNRSYAVLNIDTGRITCRIERE